MLNLPCFSRKIALYNKNRFVTTGTNQIKPKQCKEVLKITKILKILLFTKLFLFTMSILIKIAHNFSMMAHWINNLVSISFGWLFWIFGLFSLHSIDFKMWCENLIWFKFNNLYHISVSPFPSNFFLFFDFFGFFSLSRFFWVFFFFLDLFLGFFLFHFSCNCFNINNNNWREKNELNGFLQRMETRTILFSS